MQEIKSGGTRKRALGLKIVNLTVALYSIKFLYWPKAMNRCQICVRIHRTFECNFSVFKSVRQKRLHAGQY